MSISVTIKGLDGIVVELGKFGPELARTVVLDMSQVAFDKVQEGAGRHRGTTGALWASVFNRALGADAREVGHDSQRAPHATYVLHGTPPHVIRPKNKKALRWVSGNKFAFAKLVNHPGYRGDNYIDTAADDAIRAFPGIVDRAVKGL